MVERCWASLNAVREYWREPNFRIRQAGAFISHSFDSLIKCPVAPVASHECTSSDSDSCTSDFTVSCTCLSFLLFKKNPCSRNTYFYVSIFFLALWWSVINS